MATPYCIPNRLEAAPPGERLTYHWLSEALPSQYRVWHEPRVGGKKPDVVLFGEGCGLVVVEVKDWSRDSIEGLGGDEVFLREAGGAIAKTHPLKQAEGHAYAISDALKRARACVHAEGNLRGRLRFPWACFAALPNMTRTEVEDLGLGAGYEPGVLFTREDIGSPDAWGLTGEALVRRLIEGFRVRFRWEYGPQMADSIHATLFPETTVGTGYAGRARTGFDADLPDEPQQGSLALDTRVPFSEEQRRIALDLGSGHQVLQGVAGSGKSEVVAARARILADAFPSWRILVLCYNLSLASWLRARIFEGGSLQSHPVTVAHFHAWGRDLLDRAGIRYARSLYEEDEGFPDLIRSALEDGRITQRYDAVVIDEGQDFTAPMTRAALAALREESDSFLFAIDNAQRIYSGRLEPLSRLGVSARGRTHVLKNNRRCTREINTFSRRFLWGDLAEGESQEVGDARFFVPISSERRGVPVHVVQCDDLEGQVECAAAQSQELLEKGFTPDEIAILYMRSRVAPDGSPAAGEGEAVDLVAALREKFASSDLPLFWMAESQTAKADAPLELGQVTLSTVHSFKGLEARAVILVGADQPVQAIETNLRDKSLLYVGMTRATDRLIITWSNPDGIGRMLDGLG